MMELPVLIVSNAVLMPEARMKVPIRTRQNIAMLDRFVVNKIGAGKSLILVAYKVDAPSKCYEVGTVAIVESVVVWKMNTSLQYTVNLLGVSRARIQHFAYPLAKVQQMYSIEGESEVDILSEFLENSNTIALTYETSAEEFHTFKKLYKERNLDGLADFTMSLIKQDGSTFQEMISYLGTVEISKRVKIANEFLRTAIKQRDGSSSENHESAEAFNLETIVGPSTNPRKSRPNNNRPRAGSIEDLEQRLKKAGLPDNVKDSVWADFERLRSMGQQNSEQHVLMGYLDLVASLPWSRTSHDQIHIAKARELLEASHDGMESAKKRVLEYLAVRKLNDRMGGPILCFAGPPGIGKTSIAKAIAESLGRKFERVSLGGIRDESDIRGHRRTYVAAMPGRIIQSLKHAGTNNPVILLDEVDKLFAGVHGSPSAALLEVLDPEQNNSFTDHYLNLPFDLSNVIFIATANDLSKIEGPLADRLEIIEMSGYSTAEKCSIATRHIIPRQLALHGICPDHLDIQPTAIVTMIECYTRESGVRQLERTVAAICRHAALNLADALNTELEADCMTNLDLPIAVDNKKTVQILGRERYNHLDMVEKMGRFSLGTCFGMAWTPYGGEVLVIEASMIPGKGRITMTGKLGEVLRESVDVARTWIKANASRHHIESLQDSDIHVHLPSGGVNKDGPSAGCAIVSALFSLASSRKVRNDTAITGEISLSGQTLPVGGIKEKVLGAHRCGLRRVILPDANRKDTDEIDATVKADMEILFANTIDDVLEMIIEKTKVISVLSKL